MTPEAPYDCALCPRLVQYRNDNSKAEPDWHNAPVDSFGDPNARLLVVGLAPGKTGANRTARPFTGDYAGDLLYETIEAFQFSNGKYDSRADDGLELVDCMITNAVRCAPPENKPTSAEINACRTFLFDRIAALPNVRVLITLGKISHDSTIRSLGQKLSAHPFGHAREYKVDHPSSGAQLTIISSYHCSRYNTNTGRLTTEMFRKVFELAKAAL